MGTKQNILIVGAGFAGATIARELAENDYTVTVIDSRDHIGGNAYDYINEHGLRIHKYGPHIFHTSNKKVFDWVSKFTEWTFYEHHVLALLESGKYVPFPVNTTTLQTVKKEDVYRTFFEPYSKKMWGEHYKTLSKDVLNRVSTRDNDDDRYFRDEYQYLPTHGYTTLFTNILNHPNITVKLNTLFDKSMENSYDHIFNSMPIDVYYDFVHGELPYRSIKFHSITFPLPNLLPTTVVNFTDNGSFTRMTEWNKLPNNIKTGNTTLTFEEPCDYKDNNNERYYPIDMYRDLYKKYREIENPKNTFIGRCGMYVYIDMHMAISSSLDTVHSYMKQENIN
jgi:UDP-galactopyranose mutase